MSRSFSVNLKWPPKRSPGFASREPIHLRSYSDEALLRKFALSYGLQRQQRMVTFNALFRFAHKHG
jgi:hypothetical protein